MNLRWLIFDYVDPELPLTWRQRWAIMRKANRKFGMGFRIGLNWRDLVWLTAQFTPGLLLVLVLAVPQVLPLPSRWMTPLHVFVPILLMYWLLLAAIGRWLWRPWLLAALREEGFDVCLRCGYWLHDLDDRTERCPECGRRRDPLAADVRKEQA